MKEFNLEEYNKLCAEFMNLIPACEPYIRAYIIPNDFKESEFSKLIFETMLENKSWYVYPEFDSNWNWIMEVVENIVSVSQFKTVDECTEKEWYATIGVTRIPITSKKEEVVQAIWQFLNWYKENGGNK